MEGLSQRVISSVGLREDEFGSEEEEMLSRHCVSPPRPVCADLLLPLFCGCQVDRNDSCCNPSNKGLQGIFQEKKATFPPVLLEASTDLDEDKWKLSSSSRKSTNCSCVRRQRRRKTPPLSPFLIRHFTWPKVHFSPFSGSLEEKGLKTKTEEGEKVAVVKVTRRQCTFAKGSLTPQHTHSLSSSRTPTNFFTARRPPSLDAI